MFRSIYIHLLFAVVLSLIVFFSSYSNNLVNTSLTRACIAFVVGWIVAYVFRYIWKLASANTDTLLNEIQSNDSNETEVNDSNVNSDKNETEVNSSNVKSDKEKAEANREFEAEEISRVVKEMMRSD